MKKFLALMLVALLSMALFVGCTPDDEPDQPDATEGPVSAADIPNEMTSDDGKYEIAFVTDVGQLMDKSFNQGTWEGCKLYAYENDLSYKYYQPANGDQATDDDRINAMKAACDGGAKVVVAAGFMQAAALRTVAQEYTDVNFIFIDGWAVTDEVDEDGNDIGTPLDNCAGIAYAEQQSGYLAGYAAVMEGYTKLGFCGGGGGDNPACCRYGYGFLQGADAAAAVKDVDVEVNYSWQYGATFSASTELQTMASGWYASGTEVIFACGGAMFASITNAAAENDAKVIGVDVDQSFESDYVITSALKGLSASVEWALAKVYDGTWSDIGAKTTSLGAADDAVGLPTETWSLQNWTVEEYNALFEKIRSGELVIDDQYPTDHVFGFDNVAVNVI